MTQKTPAQILLASLLLTLISWDAPARATTCTYTSAQIANLINTEIIPGIPGGIRATTLNTILNAQNNCAFSLSTISGTPSANTFLRGDLTWAGVNISNLTATGTPSSTTFLRGDNTWSTPAGASSITGWLFALSLGFNDQGTDNAPLVAPLNAAMKGNGSGPTGVPVYFEANENNPNGVSNYYFTQPLAINQEGAIYCGVGAKSGPSPSVVFDFAPGVPGVHFDNFPPYGTSQGDLSGCTIRSLGWVISPNGQTTLGSATVPTAVSKYGGDQPTHPVTIAVGDALVMVPYFNFSISVNGTINGDVLTVTSFASPTDPEIGVGQLLTGGGIAHGIYIRGSGITGDMCDSLPCTGTGGNGTYWLNYSIAAPYNPSEAIPGGVATGGFYSTRPSGPMSATGAYVLSCTGGSGTQCGTNTYTDTLTLSTTANLTFPYQGLLLPGPNSTTGSQMYTVTSTATGNFYGPLTGGISGQTLTVTAGGSGLNLGQFVIGVNGGTVSTTTTANLTVGEYQNIPVASCSGVNGGAYVVGFSSGNMIFPPGTTVQSCSSNLLAVNIYGPQYVGANSGSAIITSIPNSIYPYDLNVGLPVTGANFGPNTTVQSWIDAPWDSTRVQITLNTPATSGSGAPTLAYFGGAVYAAPSGATLTFLNGQDGAIQAFGTGTGGNGTYQLTGGYTLAPGSTLYAYDTPSLVYITGGPRPLMPQDLIWADFAPFGTIVQGVYNFQPLFGGTWPAPQTIRLAQTLAYSLVPATVSHAAGSGKMWVMPAAQTRSTQGASYGNTYQGFALGLNMACMQSETPETGCGKSSDIENVYLYNLGGRLSVGNNAGGFLSMGNQYDHNFLCDICDFSTVGGLFISELLQGADESSNTQILLENCQENGSSFFSVYGSGAGDQSTCLGVSGNFGSVSIDGALGQGPYWSGTLYGSPYNVSGPLGTAGANLSGGGALVNGTPTVGHLLQWSATGVQDAGPPAAASDVQAGTSNSLYITPVALSGSASPQTLIFVSGGTTAWNAALGYNAVVTLTDSTTTIGNPTNLISGITYSLELINGGGGPFSASWGTYFNWGSAGAPAAASGKTRVSCFAETTSALQCAFNKGY